MRTHHILVNKAVVFHGMREGGGLRDNGEIAGGKAIMGQGDA